MKNSEQEGNKRDILWTVMNRSVIPLLILLLIFFIPACDIFETREAEKPDQPKSNMLQPVTPQDVITNLIHSLEDRDVENYLSCFSDTSNTEKTFQFSPSAGASAQFPQLTQMWDKENERQYFNNLRTRIPDGTRISLILSNSNHNPLVDSSVFTATYTLNIPQNESNIPVNYEGELRFSLIRNSSSLWSIYFWVDIKKDNNPSWSELKGRLYN